LLTVRKLVIAIPLLEIFFAERVVNVFSSLVSFRQTIESVDFTDFLKCSFD